MKHTIKIMMLMAALTLGWGCSSDDDDNSATQLSAFTAASEAPQWRVDMKWKDAAPNWTAPEPSLYESAMFILVKLQDELAPYASADDRMTVFIDSVCRTMPSMPSITSEGVFFVLKIRGNSADRNVNIKLCYYCSNLKQIFTINGQETFAAEKTYGHDNDFVPPLLLGSSKYPVQNYLTVSLPVQTPFTPDNGDIVGAFVNDECRGVGTVGKPFTVYRTNNSEIITLRYFSATKGGVYSLSQTVNISEQQNSLTLNF